MLAFILVHRITFMRSHRRGCRSGPVTIGTVVPGSHTHKAMIVEEGMHVVSIAGKRRGEEGAWECTAVGAEQAVRGRCGMGGVLMFRLRPGLRLSFLLATP